MNIQYAFTRFHLPSKYLTLSPSAVSVASNKQKVCTKARKVLIFHTDYLRPSKRVKNPCFYPHFETLDFALTQLQELVENFLMVVWPWYGYVKSSSGYKLSNALILILIRHTDRAGNDLVQTYFFTPKNKTPPLSSWTENFQQVCNLKSF